MSRSASAAPRSPATVENRIKIGVSLPILEKILALVVDISPSEIVRRHSAAWSGLHVETVQVMRHTPFEYGFRAPCHLLIALELGERLDGETVVEGLPRSTLRDFTHKLTFVPAGHDFRSWQKPRVLTRVTHFYIDPREPLADPALRFGEIEFKPRLFFYDRDLWDTALKFKSQVENPGSMPRLYAEALGIVLTHELVRINSGAARRDPVNRGGLAPWQQKRVAAYIEERVANDIPLATLAELARLSPYHFCRSFKRSFGRRTDITRFVESNGPSSYWRIANCPSRRLRSMSASATRRGSGPFFIAGRATPRAFIAPISIRRGGGGGGPAL